MLPAPDREALCARLQAANLAFLVCRVVGIDRISFRQRSSSITEGEVEARNASVAQEQGAFRDLIQKAAIVRYEQPGQAWAREQKAFEDV